MKVHVRWRDIRVYQAVIEVPDGEEVTEETVNTLPDEKFIEPPVEVEGWLDIEYLDKV